jgi:hypothetical protein
MTATCKLAILFFDLVEALDFCGPFEVFSVTNHFTYPGVRPRLRAGIIVHLSPPRVCV